jgi:hypothetical protein
MTRRNVSLTVSRSSYPIRSSAFIGSIVSADETAIPALRATLMNPSIGAFTG